MIHFKLNSWVHFSYHNMQHSMRLPQPGGNCYFLQALSQCFPLNDKDRTVNHKHFILWLCVPQCSFPHYATNWRNLALALTVTLFSIPQFSHWKDQHRINQTLFQVEEINCEKKYWFTLLHTTFIFVSQCLSYSVETTVGQVVCQFVS